MNNFLHNCQPFNPYYCTVDISFTLISLTIISLSIFALYKMTSYYKRIQFENTVITGGIIETILIMCSLFFPYELLHELSEAFQVYITAFISSRLVLNILQSKDDIQNLLQSMIQHSVDTKQQHRIPWHNVLLVIIYIINTLLIAINVVTLFMWSNVKLADVVFSIFALCVSALLFVLSCVVITYMKTSLVKSHCNDKEECSYAGDSVVMKKPMHETFYKTKTTQLMLIAVVNVVCTVYQGVFTYGLHSFLKGNVNLNKNRVLEEIDNVGFALIRANQVSNMLMVGTNLFAFYFLIKSQFEIDVDVKAVNFTYEDIFSHSLEGSYSEAYEYLEKNSVKRSTKRKKTKKEKEDDEA